MSSAPRPFFQDHPLLSYPMKWLTPFPTFARGHAEWGACYRGWRLRAVGWPGGWRQAASEGGLERWLLAKRRPFYRPNPVTKRGNLSMADDTRTTTQQRTQHAPVAPHNDSCSQLRVIYDCPAVFSASSVHAGGQRRPFRHAFKSQMRSSRASEVHPRSSIQPSKLGGTASCSHTCTVERSGQMGVTIATGLSDCRGHSPGEVSTRPRVSWQRQQHSADDMPMIATSRGVHMTTASSWGACLTMRCPHLIKLGVAPAWH